MNRINNLKKYQLNSIIKITSNCYHSSESGVYGYKPKSIEEFKVNEEVLKSRNSQSNVYRWVESYRQYGHLIAKVNPVDFREQQSYIPELDITKFGLNENEIFNPNGILNNNFDSTSNNNNNNTIEYARKYLESFYCGTTSMEINHIESIHEKEWLSENYEQYLNEIITIDVQKEIATLLIKSQAWDNFMAVKFPTVKRYGGEGAESMLAFFRQIFNSSIDAEIDHIVLGMPHRGKLNLLTTMLKTPPAKIFRKFKGHPELPAEAKAMCDIASHFHVSETLNFNGKDIGFSLIHNPSHLEINNPVSMGKTRSKQQTSRDGAFSDDAAKPFSTSVLNLQLHGDAAFAGQGVNQEMLMMAGTPHFDVGGSIHMIVNNQVGFTTPGDRGRITRYSSDLVKCVNVPIFHVNGDDPEALTKITKLAFAYQRKFRKDVFIDFNCYRRWGHNEVDDPTFTNPALYKIIHSRKSVPDLYTEKLIKENILTNELVSDVVKSHMAFLNDELVNSETYQPDAYYFKKQWTGIEQASNAITYWDTGIDYNLLRYIGEQSVYFPSKFNVHPHLLKMHVNSRLKKIDEGMKIDWATAEAMAFGSLMYQGHNVRISGEDVGRGTFSQRHAMLIDQQTNEMWVPLNTLKGGLGGKLEVANSILSEEAVLAFEYGMAMDNPNNLIIWEAQFGDFFNGAQIVIDTYIASGETKWMMSNGLVMLLPHGYDGAASEHSSCRIERFLQQTDSKETQPDGDDINMQIVNPSTPAQYFHLLRRQMLRNYRKPLVVIAPKTVLRLSEATSTHNEFQPGTTFLPVIGDVIAKPEQVKRILLCSGKHYYNLNQERIEKRHEDVAIIRVESLCPFPVQEITNELDKYKNAKFVIWCQEEHRNMGAWTFIKPRFENMCARKIKYCGRYEGATPAVGVSIWHKAESDYIVQTPFKTN